MEDLRQKRLGELKLNNQGCEMKIVEYINSNNLVVEFQDDYKYRKRVSYGNYKKGYVDNPYYPSVYNVGISGDISKIKNEPYYEKARKVWRSMLQRCYDPKVHDVENTYLNCEVCEEWKLFTNFYSWFVKNYYELDDEVVQLDKDILLKGNKIYCPEYCCFVPHTINSLFTKTNKNRGDCPIGVTWINRDQVYRAQCNNGSKKEIALGTYNNIIDAFNAYKNYKEKVIKQIADKYKNTISKNVYDAMYKYKVEITD